MDVELVSIDADGATSRVVRITGEAPGHVNRVSGIDVSVDRTTLAVSSAMPARTVVRSPVMPPFDRVATIDPVFETAGFAIGVGGARGRRRGLLLREPTADLRPRHPASCGSSTTTSRPTSRPSCTKPEDPSAPDWTAERHRPGTRAPTEPCS